MRLKASRNAFLLVQVKVHRFARQWTRVASERSLSRAASAQSLSAVATAGGALGKDGLGCDDASIAGGSGDDGRSAPSSPARAGLLPKAPPVMLPRLMRLLGEGPTGHAAAPRAHFR